MITLLIVVIWFFVVLPYVFRRMFPPVPVVIEPPAPAPAVTVFTPSIVIHVHLSRPKWSRLRTPAEMVRGFTFCL